MANKVSPKTKFVNRFSPNTSALAIVIRADDSKRPELKGLTEALVYKIRQRSRDGVSHRPTTPKKRKKVRK